MTDEETLLCVVFVVIIFCIVINFISSALQYLRKLKIEQDQATQRANHAQRRTVYTIGDDIPAPRGTRPPAYPDDFVELYFPPNSHHIKDDKDLPTYDEVMRLEAEAAERVAARRLEQGESTASSAGAVTAPTPPLPPAPVTADSRV